MYTFTQTLFHSQVPPVCAACLWASARFERELVLTSERASEVQASEHGRAVKW
jgi:hypothetical protein